MLNIRLLPIGDARKGRFLSVVQIWQIIDFFIS